MEKYKVASALYFPRLIGLKVSNVVVVKFGDFEFGCVGLEITLYHDRVLLFTL